MRKDLFIAFFFFIIQFSYAQENPLPFIQQESPYDVSASFPGGVKAQLNYFEDNLRYPKPEKGKADQGEVYIKMIITAEGKIKDVQLLNGIPYRPNLAKEAVRIVQSMPAWIPATKNGKAVESEYYLSVPFKLNKQGK